MIDARGLYLAAAGFGLAALALRVIPPTLPAVPSAADLPAVIPARPAQRPAVSGAAHEAIVAANVFSATRSPPTIRFTPEGMTRPDTAASRPPRAKPSEPVIRLYGITRSASGAVALIDADPRVPGAEVYRVGDRVGAWPISAITDSTVVIARQPRPLVLRLAASGERSP